MCRVLSYLGPPVSFEQLLYEPDNSFIKQSYNPRYMSHLLNLAGFGLVAWDSHSYHPDVPYIYKTTFLPFYDQNLKHLARKIKPACFLTHIRGVPYNRESVVSNENVHPFMYEGTDIALAHNGSLSQFDRMKADLFEHIRPEYRVKIEGTTDSEWIYALFLSQLSSTHIETADQLIDALLATFKILIKIRKKLHINSTSPVNLFISNGKFIAATRYALDYGWHLDDGSLGAHHAYHSLWYTYGEEYGFFDNEYRMRSGDKRSCIIIASEPLTEDATTWIELPEYTVMVAWHEDQEVKIVSRDIVL